MVMATIVDIFGITFDVIFNVSLRSDHVGCEILNGAYAEIGKQ